MGLDWPNWGQREVTTGVGKHSPPQTPDPKATHVELLHLERTFPPGYVLQEVRLQRVQLECRAHISKTSTIFALFFCSHCAVKSCALCVCREEVDAGIDGRVGRFGRVGNK